VQGTWNFVTTNKGFDHVMSNSFQFRTFLHQFLESVQMQCGEYLRAAALHCLPPTVPALNREAWAELARLAANINQYPGLAQQRYQKSHRNFFCYSTPRLVMCGWAWDPSFCHR
jgi:hypothetical protein